MARELTSPPPGSPLGLGTDVVDIDRFRSVLERTPSFATRVFTSIELELCRRRRDPVPCLAGRFAVKEAVLKVFGTGLGGAAMSEIEVRRGPDGQPVLHLGGAAAERADAQGIVGWLVSVSHSDLVAQAVVIGLA